MGTDADEFDPLYLKGIAFFNACEFFEAHEVWEDLWKSYAGPLRLFYKGLIQAAVATLAVFSVLTAVVFISRKDFSFLGPILGISSLLIFGAIVLGAFGLLNLGTGFCMLLVVFASGAILYDTSNVLHKYRTEQYVAAALQLFASVGLLFWYILQIVISMSDRR